MRLEPGYRARSQRPAPAAQRRPALGKSQTGQRPVRGRARLPVPDLQRRNRRTDSHRCQNGHHDPTGGRRELANRDRHPEVRRGGGNLWPTRRHRGRHAVAKLRRHSRLHVPATPGLGQSPRQYRPPPHGVPQPPRQHGPHRHGAQLARGPGDLAGDLGAEERERPLRPAGPAATPHGRSGCDRRPDRQPRPRRRNRLGRRRGCPGARSRCGHGREAQPWGHHHVSPRRPQHHRAKAGECHRRSLDQRDTGRRHARGRNRGDPFQDGPDPDHHRDRNLRRRWRYSPAKRQLPRSQKRQQIRWQRQLWGHRRRSIDQDKRRQRLLDSGWRPIEPHLRAGQLEFPRWWLRRAHRPGLGLLISWRRPRKSNRNQFPVERADRRRRQRHRREFQRLLHWRRPDQPDWRRVQLVQRHRRLQQPRRRQRRQHRDRRRLLQHRPQRQQQHHRGWKSEHRGRLLQHGGRRRIQLCR